MVLRVMGIDQAANDWCGFALVSGIEETNDQDSTLEYWDVETYHKLKTKKQRLERFGENIIKFVDAWKPDVLLMEDIRLYNGGLINIHTIVALGGMLGVALYVKPSGVPLYVVDTGLWKRTVVGVATNKQDKKADTIAYVSRRFGMVVDDHTSDAICIALYPFCKEEDDLIKSRRKGRGGTHNDLWRKIV